MTFKKHSLALSWLLGLSILVSASATPVHAITSVDSLASATSGTEVKSEKQPIKAVPIVPKSTTALPKQPLLDTSKYQFSVHFIHKGYVLASLLKTYKLDKYQLMALNPTVTNPHKLPVGYPLIVGRTLRSASDANRGGTQKTDQGSKLNPPGQGVNIATNYSNGTYRGSFTDGGYEQVGVEFKLFNQQITAIKFSVLTYKGIDYLKSVEAPVVQLRDHYQHLATYLINKPLVSALEDLYKPGEVLKKSGVTVDATAGATLRSSKITSAVKDALNRGPYALSGEGVNYDSGTYRGDFTFGGQQVVIEFDLKDNKFEKLSYRLLSYKGVDYKAAKEGKDKHVLDQFNGLLNYLKGKDIRTSLTALYHPALIVSDLGSGVDAVTGATVRSGKVVSAIQNALSRGVYKPLDAVVETKKIFEKPYADGVYRGSYLDGGIQSVGLELTLKKGIITGVKYRTLAYKDVNYLSSEANIFAKTIEKQYQALIAHLMGKPLSAVVDLYKPGSIAQDAKVGVDVVTGASLRSGKVISALADALNRGVYSK